MKYRAIIFDLDGTIIDTEKIWKQVTREVIIRRGIQITPELDEELEIATSGRDTHSCCKIIKDLTLIPDSVEQLVAEKNILAHQFYHSHATFIEGFATFHEQVRAHNLGVAIATNATDEGLAISKAIFKLESFFGHHIYNISYVQKPKPDPAIYLHAANALEMDPALCIAIEDSFNGIRAAVDAGMFCIGINSMRKPHLLTNSHLIVDAYADINLPQLIYPPITSAPDTAPRTPAAN